MIGCYAPGFKAGGPIRSLSNLALGARDALDFRIITSDRDLGSTQPHEGVVLDRWIRIRDADVYYVSPANQSVRALARLIRETPHDALYLSGFFDDRFSIRPIVARYLRLIPKRPVILAPRGEFSESALALNRWKKRIYILVAAALGLYGDVVWQASNEREARDIRRVLRKHASRVREVRDVSEIAPETPSRIVIAPNVAVRAKATVRRLPQSGPHRDAWLRICTLSRISPVKNIDYALRVLSDVTARVEYTVYGVLEDRAYWNRCQQLIEKLPSNVKVRYLGELKHSDVHEALGKHELFFFPTRGENFGHVIHEALAAGLPVLLSDQTPWRNLEAYGAGWDLPLESREAFCQVIEAQASMSVEAKDEQLEAVRSYVNRISASNREVIAGNVAMFAEVLTREAGMERDQLSSY
jgi:glycosyltransferase involved in cell wall biosynthesis